MKGAKAANRGRFGLGVGVVMPAIPAGIADPDCGLALPMAQTDQDDVVGHGLAAISAAF